MARWCISDLGWAKSPGTTAKKWWDTNCATDNLAAAPVGRALVVPATHSRRRSANPIDTASRSYCVVMGKSIRIDSRCRIVMKNFDSVPQLQLCFSCVHHCAAKIASWLTFASMSLLASARAISSSVVMQADRSWLRWTGPAASAPESRTPGVDCRGGSDRAVNRIESNRFLFCRIAHHYYCVCGLLSAGHGMVLGPVQIGTLWYTELRAFDEELLVGTEQPVRGPRRAIVYVHLQCRVIFFW